MLSIESLDKNGRQALIMSTFFTFLTTLAVVLRLITFRVTKATFGWSEALLLLAQSCWYTQYGIFVHVLVVGRTIKSDEDPRLRTVGFKGLYLIADFYFPLVFLTNASILLLYRRLFPISALKRATTVVLVVHSLWFIASFLVGVLICIPPKTLWLQPELMEQDCVNFDSFYGAVLSTELVLDLLILALPIIHIVHLKVPLSRRVELICVFFLLGGLVIVTGLIRIIKSVAPDHVFGESIDYIVELFWMDIHAGTAIICACLPTYRPLVVKTVSVLSRYSSNVFSSVADAGPQTSNGSTSYRITSDGSQESGHRKGRQNQYAEYQRFGSDEEIHLEAVSSGGRAESS